MKVSRHSVVMDRIVKLEEERAAAIARSEAAERVVELADRTMSCLFEFEDAPEACAEWMDHLDTAIQNYRAAYDAQRTEDDGE